MKKELTEVNLYMRIVNGKEFCFLQSELNDFDNDTEIEKYTKETVRIKHASWDLKKYLESISASYSPLGAKLSSDEDHIETVVRYLVKECSFLDLEFDFDDYGHERISDTVWNDITKVDSLDPHIILGMYRATLTINTI